MVEKLKKRMQNTLKSRWLVPFVIAMSLSGLGYMIASYSWNSKIFISTNGFLTFPNASSRAITSSNPQLIEFNRDQLLDKQNQSILVQQAVIKYKSDVTTISLPSFIVQQNPSVSGNTVLVCERYQTINFTFIASSQSVHGHSPRMRIKDVCRHTEDKQFIVLTLPKAQILEAPITTTTFLNGEQSIRFDDLHVRPQEWTLTQISFSGLNDKKPFDLDFDLSARTQYLTITWE